jgi:hypothetical protein
MTEQAHEPDHVAEEKARRERDERAAIADGDGTGSTGDEQQRQESGYSTEDEQGSAQPSPAGS